MKIDLGEKEDTAPIEQYHKRFNGISYVAQHFAIPALLAAFFLQGNLAQLSSYDRMACFTIVFIWVLATAVSYDFSLNDKFLGLVPITFSVLFVAAIASIMSPSFKEDEANRRRCMTIQTDMLSASPRMANPADAFQALGCRPQGTDARIFVRPRKPVPPAPR